MLTEFSHIPLLTRKREPRADPSSIQLSDFPTVRYNMAHFTPGITKRVAKQQSYLQFRDLEFLRWFHFTWEGTKPKAIESMKVNKRLKSSG